MRLKIDDGTDGGGNFSCHDKNSQTDDNDDEIPQTCGVVECSSIRKRSCQKIICLPHFNHSHWLLQDKDSDDDWRSENVIN